MKELFRTRNLAHAHLVVAVLETEGIAAHLQGEHDGFAAELSVFVREPTDWNAARAMVAKLELEIDTD